MAARRLLIVMLVLLGLSTLAAALIPTRDLKEAGTGSTASTETETETTSTAATNSETTGEALGIKIRVEGDTIPVVPIKVGDQLALTVISERSDQIEIPALGLLETVGPDLPATFDVLITEPGDYGIRSVERDRVVAKLRVEPRPAS